MGVNFYLNEPAKICSPILTNTWPLQCNLHKIVCQYIQSVHCIDVFNLVSIIAVPTDDEDIYEGSGDEDEYEDPCQGDPGPKGDIGLPGSKGDVGPRGIQGPAVSKSFRFKILTAQIELIMFVPYLPHIQVSGIITGIL